MAVKIEIAPYSPDWAMAFEQERDHLEAALEALSPIVEHIGSTAVKGLGAKPIIDILIGIPENITLSALSGPLLELGYCYYPCYEKELPRRRFFARLCNKKGEVYDSLSSLPQWEAFPHTHHLHAVHYDSPFWKRPLTFRDYLRTHPVARDAYHRMKVKAAKGKWESGDDYSAAKTAFICSVEWLMRL